MSRLDACPIPAWRRLIVRQARQPFHLKAHSGMPPRARAETEVSEREILHHLPALRWPDRPVLAGLPVVNDWFVVSGTMWPYSLTFGQLIVCVLNDVQQLRELAAKFCLFIF
jgi:hypothetical protein